MLLIPCSYYTGTSHSFKLKRHLGLGFVIVMTLRSLRGLRSKYRGEEERENLWDSYQAANAFSNTALVENDLILPVAKVALQFIIVSSDVISIHY
jgi:hypothetical protein